MNIQPHMQSIINMYYENEAKKLHEMVDKVLRKLHFTDIDKEDFYSLATDIFVNEVLYTTLYKKFCTYMTRNTRNKRCTKVKVVEKDQYGNDVIKTKIIPDKRLDAPVNGDEDSVLEDMISSNSTVEKEIFDSRMGSMSEKVNNG